MSADDVASLLSDAGQRLALQLTSFQLAQLGRYAELVHKWQRISNLTAAPTTLGFAREHIIDCLAVTPHVPAGRLLDVGSGAGLPGIVLAISLPSRALTLLEPRGKRARFLTQVKIELELANVDIVTQRVEHYRPAHVYHAVIARAFGPLIRLLEATRALQQPGTRVLAMKGRLDRAEIAECGLAADALEVVALQVPGYVDRNLVVIDCSGLSSGLPAAGEAS